jgi:hypothetical protein
LKIHVQMYLNTSPVIVTLFAMDLYFVYSNMYNHLIDFHQTLKELMAISNEVRTLLRLGVSRCRTCDVSDMTPTHIITLNYVLFSNYILPMWALVCFNRFLPDIKIWLSLSNNRIISIMVGLSYGYCCMHKSPMRIEHDASDTMLESSMFESII